MNFTGKSAGIQKRKQSGMVYMRMGHERKVEHRRRDWQLLIFKNVLALLHAAVNNALFIPDLEQSAASRYLVGST